jgi:hypothetical protein
MVTTSVGVGEDEDQNSVVLILPLSVVEANALVGTAEMLAPIATAKTALFAKCLMNPVPSYFDL